MILDNPVRSYPWGSPTVIPELLGVEPTGEPQAELWIGAHPGSPSTVAGDGRTLDRYIADDPGYTLGSHTVKRFGLVLPYLLKVLAVEQPLSIQAHPTIEQAKQGYAAEEVSGIPLDSPERSYRDRNHKPEMVVALTDFDALVGFRDPEDTARALRATGKDELRRAAELVVADNGLRELVRMWLALPEPQIAPFVEAVTDAAATEAVRREHEALDVVAGLAETYPGDRGLLLALMLRRISLGPGEAAFVGAGVPHAYLGGTAVEIQASSDNTLRAGLTSKHVDTLEVDRILRYEASGHSPTQDDTMLIPPIRQAGPGEHVYHQDALDEFRLCRLDMDAGEIHPSGAGPRIVLVTDGFASLRTGPAGAARDGRSEDTTGPMLELRRGQAAFVPAGEWLMSVSGTGTAFSVTPNM
ncbi:mannose-6-phosphate isomerase, class I [Actinobacteria bacterium YIM 96077]|uniref:mannose-6-phosphate isomerase n=1 Tax=Phytoactinopolyspora halophila TaxID=1981511 RepID=A0A329R300_9ACTN|nr:mannose-6-phosphate isomerase, class I [Actinobacteria bacterium YIM 96077]RAW18957.1 mannose-6-phosphate isomerase, class I [Phytoactinopolyspora halophila]